MSLYRSLVRPLAFRLDPERVHEMALRLVAHGLIRGRRFEDPRLEQTLFGVRFPNPLGLAAGFDKNGVALNQWRHLGFGFVEAGTVTYHAQSGNPKPRMFRLPHEKAILNRLGFNNEGAAALAARLETARPGIPLGINLGKSKVTELAEAPHDYRSSYELLHQRGDYFVVNVSSPNTPGLRSLQEKGPLLDILQAMREVDPDRPIFVKVAPDLELSALDEVVEVAIETQLTGLIATNTTLQRSMLARDPDIAGGLSGAPLTDLANRVLAHLARQVPTDMILIGVGGVMSGRDLFDKIALGAHLCQVYTGWVYGGPGFVALALEELLECMRREGFGSLSELRGSALRREAM